MLSERLRGRRRAEVAAELADQFQAQSNPTMRMFAARVGYPGTVVRRLLEEAGVRSRRCLIGFTDEVVAAELADQYQRGTTVAALAFRTGLGEKRIYALLNSAGVDTARPEPGPMTMTDDEIVDAYLHGATIQHLVQEAGGSSTIIRQILLTAGVQLRARGTAWRRRTADRNRP